MLERTLSRDEELGHLESMRASALLLARGGDALVCGQIAQILGAIEALMTVVAVPAQALTAHEPQRTAHGNPSGAKGALPEQSR